MPKWLRVRNALDQTTLIPDGALEGYLNRGWTQDNEDEAEAPTPEPVADETEPVSETEPDLDVEETD